MSEGVIRMSRGSAALLRALVLGSVLLVLPSCSNAAQQNAPPSPQQLEESSKERDVRRLLQLNGTLGLAEQVRTQFVHDARQIYATVPQTAIMDFGNRIKADDFYALMVPIYARHFSHEEINQLIAFYESPVGRKLIASLPAMNVEAQDATAQWTRELTQQLVQELRAKRYIATP
jgi:uncharacterized protein